MRGTSLAAIALAAAGCRANGPVDTGEFVPASIDTSVTPDRWLRVHRGDTIGVRGEMWSWDAHHQNCRTAIGDETRGTLRAHHVALFVVPHPPADLAFDADTVRLAERRCELHAVAVVFTEPDSAAAYRLSDSLTTAVAAHGPHTGVTTVVGVTPTRRGTPNGSSGWQTMVTVSTTAGDYAKDPVAMSRDAVHAGGASATWASLDSALTVAAIPGTTHLATELERLAPQRRILADPRRVDAVALPALRALLRASANLPPARRAAALVAADLLVSGVAPGFSLNSVIHKDVEKVQDRNRRQAYEAAGVKYDAEPGGDDDGSLVGYDERWRALAYHADSLSVGGHLAFRLIFGEDGQIGPGCSRNERYENVIELGEAGLRDYPGDSARLQQPLAFAYADRLSMAMGLDSGTVFLRQMNERYEGFYSEKTHDADLGPVRATMPETRRRGFAHARAALGLSHDPIDRRALWHLMFRAVAGIPGSITYFCMGE